MIPTIKDVAKHADVSIATVSRILNSQTGYSEKTKQKVLNSIKELGYQPNAVARGLINKKTQTIGVLFPDVSSMLSSAILKGIEDAAHNLGHSVIVCHTASRGKRTLKYLQLLREKRVDGIIFASERMLEEYYEVVQQMDVPVILISTESSYDIPFVKVDDKRASYSATEYLVKKGHCNIGFISGPIEDKIAGLPRLEGFKQALYKNGIQLRQQNIVVTKGFGYEHGRDSLSFLLERSPDITGIVAASDEIAVGVLTSAYKLGIKVPDQLSIIGYDNLKIAEMAIPPLTTVAQPLYQLGKEGAEMLLHMLITGEKAKSKILPHRIIERQSISKR
ncbi:LacI family DNA-binding transcriptional regulator [Sediminibacillus massiliensis]|uniref:LacI family DNA-binding transcriptional regulator n=1 Tax=Sediminibacillus massiliensis TaxID=1926277 RepID=UPI0009884B5C|nr:substrate-binding domain-containing protein [Sediminibacillus massiliensis]